MLQTCCKYRLYEDVDFTVTNERPGPHPKYNHERIVRVRNVDFKVSVRISVENFIVSISIIADEYGCININQ